MRLERAISLHLPGRGPRPVPAPPPALTERFSLTDLQNQLGTMAPALFCRYAAYETVISNEVQETVIRKMLFYALCK